VGKLDNNNENEDGSEPLRPVLDTREDDSLCRLVGIDIDLKV
jgi:hypothetical protein